MAPELGLRLSAVHVDHGLDRDSTRRAIAARQICFELGIDLSILHLSAAEVSPTIENLEMVARQIRYRELESARQRLGADYIVTAHHADDQAETVLIRLLYGTGIEGLAGIQPLQDRLLRPLLHISRHELRKELDKAGIRPVRDPTNFELQTTRNRVRHLMLPDLCEEEPGLIPRLSQLASSAFNCRAVLEQKLKRELAFHKTSTGGSIDMSSLKLLPPALWPFALSMVHRQEGVPYPPSSAARRELLRQLDSSAHIGVDCGHGWRWQNAGGRLTLSQPPPSVPGFAYTVEAPGECEIPELALKFRIRRGAVDTWMFRPSSRRAGLDLPIEPGDFVVVRNRRIGDRVRPLGCRYTRRLKDLLIDRRVPRLERDRLPLLEVDSRLAWIPGVTVGEAYRVTRGKRAWIAELESI